MIQLPSQQQIAEQLLQKLKSSNSIGSDGKTRSFMIEVDIPLTYFGKLVNSKRWICMYSEMGSWGTGINGSYHDKITGGFFTFTAHRKWIHVTPRKNTDEKTIVDYYLWIKKVISKYALLMTYEEYCDKHKDENNV